MWKKNSFQFSGCLLGVGYVLPPKEGPSSRVQNYPAGASDPACLKPKTENPAPPRDACLPVSELKNSTHLSRGQLTSLPPYRSPEWLPPLEGFPESMRPSLVPCPEHPFPLLTPVDSLRLIISSYT